MKKIMIAFLAVTLIVAALAGSTYAADETSYITDVMVASGADAESELTEGGYTLMNQQLNQSASSSDKSDSVYMGYKTGTADNAITALLVSYEQEDELEHEGITYTLVSSVSLNEGNDGTQMWLYYTKDSGAGEGIVDFDFYVFEEEDESILLNDGSVVVRDDEGAAVDLDAGIDGNYVYLYTISSDLFKPYVESIIKIESGTDALASREAAANGCDYYMFSENGSYAYKRTDVLEDALKDSSGNVVVALNTLGATENMSLSSWAQIYFGGTTTAAGYTAREAGYILTMDDEKNECRVGSYSEGDAEVSVLSADSSVQEALNGYAQTEELETVDVSEYDQTRPDTVQELLTTDANVPLIVISLSVAVILLVAAALVLRYRIKKVNKKEENEPDDEAGEKNVRKYKK